MSIQKDIQELLDRGVITEDIAHKIQAYYKEQEQSSGNKMLLLFSILGATLIGLGIILMIAHNWDEFSRTIKTILSLLPILIGQGLCAYCYFKKPSWMEASAVFLGLGLGASMTLIAQVYHIPSNENAFYFTWTLLTLPLLLIPKIQTTSVLSLVLATAFALSHRSDTDDYSLMFYWVFYGVIAYYYFQINTTSIHSFFKRSFIWLLPISPLLILFKHSDNNEELLFIAYFLVFNIYYILSEHTWIQKRVKNTSALKFIGLIGMNSILVILSFYRIWDNPSNITFRFGPEVILCCILFLFSFIHYYKNDTKGQILSAYSLLKFPFIFIFSSIYFSDLGYYLMNLMTLGISVYTIQQGIKNQSLSITNIGLFTLGALILSRFFDSEFSFIVRGLVFVILGAGFLLTNYFMLKNNKINAA